uniref:Angiotensin II receptor, type 2 n=1 Tax=Erpetoichthys calabaricus TaxID=27687 RepID=A0A8C4XCA8_ERPCA
NNKIIFNNSNPGNSTLMNISFSNSCFEKLSPEKSCHSVLLYNFHSFLIPTIYDTIFVVGFIGNTIITVVRCLKVSRKTVAITYILNLAIADLLFLLSLPLWAVYYVQNYNWTFGTFLCKICCAVLSINLYASIFFITCMSVDRYLDQFITMMVWSLAFFLTLPTIYFRNTYYLEEYKVTACIMDFPQDDFSTWSDALGLMKNTLGFLVPFSIFISCYIGIGKYLLKTPYLEINKHKMDKVLLMVLAVVLALFICWFPFHILTFLDVFTMLNLITSCKLKAVIDHLKFPYKKRNYATYGNIRAPIFVYPSQAIPKRNVYLWITSCVLSLVFKTQYLTLFDATSSLNPKFTSLNDNHH